MRKLIWVPIIHNYADMCIPRSIALDPNGARYEFECKVDRFWDVVGMELARVQPDLPNTQIYMDSWFEGLTLRDAERFALLGSRNFTLIVRYYYRGAQLMQTETKNLLFIPTSYEEVVRRRSWEPIWLHEIRKQIIF